jgi:HAE1 family hydrophobic/amphiphilic exporter-1
VSFSVFAAALVPAGFIGGEFFAASDSGSFSSNRNAKDASLEQTNFMTQKSKPFRQRSFVKSQFTMWVKQVNGQLQSQP